jgi:hypothetical protein
MALLTGVPELATGQITVLNLVRLDGQFTLSTPASADCPACRGGR